MDTREGQRKSRKQQNAETPLLRLPIELKLQIYEDVVGKTCVKILDDRPRWANTAMGFLQVCRTMRNDISPIYWTRIDVCLSNHCLQVAMCGQRWLLAAPFGAMVQKALVCLPDIPPFERIAQIVLHIDTSTRLLDAADFDYICALACKERPPHV